MKKVVIIGANGFCGRQILKELSSQADYELTACSLREDMYPGAGNYRYVRLDLRNEKDLNAFFADVCPEVVINTSALSVPDYCETHRKEAYETNVTAVGQLARLCRQYASRLIHLSTDFVFQGDSRRLYTEEDLPNPVNYYGLTKWEGEKQIAGNCPDYAIVRVAIVYGDVLEGQHGNILQLVARKLRAGETIRVVSDQWRTPTFVADVARGVESLIRHADNGIFHICGNECLTISDIAYRVADYLHLDRSLILPVTTEEMNERTPRPRFSGMNIQKAQEILGYAPRSIEEGMRETFLPEASR